MRYVLVINNNEAEDNGDAPTFEEVKCEVAELLRSGYYEVERIKEVQDE